MDHEMLEDAGQSSTKKKKKKQGENHRVSPIKKRAGGSRCGFLPLLAWGSVTCMMVAPWLTFSSNDHKAMSSIPSPRFYIWIEFYLEIEEKVENTSLPVLLFTFFEGCFFLMIFSVASCCKAGSSSSSAINSGMASQHARRKFAPLTHISIAKLQSLANYCGVTGRTHFVACTCWRKNIKMSWKFLHTQTDPDQTPAGWLHSESTAYVCCSLSRDQPALGALEERA